ncbi:MAG TPA: methyltransferase domain-containing protein [Gemmatimonadales bacterium]|nr:methyltransferase domain-containing protein [Gemmatimonadales bacterium]
MIGTELLDDPRADPRAVQTELRDIARLNTLFGGTRAVLGALDPFFRRSCNMPRATYEVPWTLLDVGTGLGDIPRAAARAARRHGIALRLVGIERNRTAARLARGDGRDEPLASIVADGGALPFPSRSVDVIVASQVLHHVPRAQAARWITELDRVARRAVVLADLRRSRVAMAGVWAACFGLAMDGVTRHDAVTSLRRGYSRLELDAMLAEAGVPARARHRAGFRIVAAWEPTGP